MRGAPALTADTLRPVARLIAAGAATAAAGVLGFAIAHALLITPIWRQAFVRAPVALVAGIPMAWAFQARFGRTEGTPWTLGPRFGARLFATLLPATACESGLRLLGLRLGDWVEPAVVLALAAASGAIAGGLLNRARGQAPVAFAAAAAGLTTLMGGPVPVVNGASAALLFLSFLPLCVAAGIALASVRGRR